MSFPPAELIYKTHIGLADRLILSPERLKVCGFKLGASAGENEILRAAFLKTWDLSGCFSWKEDLKLRHRVRTNQQLSSLPSFWDPTLQFRSPAFHANNKLRFQVGNIVSGVYTLVLAKHSKSFSLIDCISVGVDRMQRSFEPMRKPVEAWQRIELTDVTAKGGDLRGFCRRKTGSP